MESVCMRRVCGKRIKATYGFNTVDIVVVDRCEACADFDLDLSPGAFEKLGPTSQGRLHGMRVSRSSEYFTHPLLLTPIPPEFSITWQQWQFVWFDSESDPPKKLKENPPLSLAITLFIIILICLPIWTAIAAAASYLSICLLLGLRSPQQTFVTPRFWKWTSFIRSFTILQFLSHSHQKSSSVVDPKPSYVTQKNSVRTNRAGLGKK